MFLKALKGSFSMKISVSDASEWLFIEYIRFSVGIDHFFNENFRLLWPSLGISIKMLVS